MDEFLGNLQRRYKINLDITSLYTYVQEQYKDILEHLLAGAVVYIFICLCLFKIIFRFRASSATKFPEHIDRILIVTAHPDDECMFFGPTILTLSRRRNCQVYLLCLTNGNYDKKGYLRRAELWKSCSELHMREENVTLLNVTELPDDPTIEWKVPVLAGIIRKHIDKLGVQAVITFDREGVSGHSNHIHIYYAIASIFLAKSNNETGCTFFILDTVNIFRKYLLVFDLPITYLLSTYCFILSWSDFAVIRKAMYQHKSQLLWFRRLYILFSRYMIMNSLEQVKEADLKLDMLLASPLV